MGPSLWLQPVGFTYVMFIGVLTLSLCLVYLFVLTAMPYWTAIV
jgi:hypothetical protein